MQNSFQMKEKKLPCKFSFLLKITAAETKTALLMSTSIHVFADSHPDN